ncbi:MAG: peptide ABC transporter substrate-binding protein [Clostridia bacterium]|nr:peptide ABC transporter substrate-binding protein [Clostridia bacterium]
MILLLLPADPALADTEKIGNIFTVGIQSSKTLSIRPLEPLERDMLSAYDIIYDSLVTIDDDYFPQPCIAQSWEYGSGGKTWTFHLREDVTFSDGTPLTAADVVASANYILDKARDENISDHGFYSTLNYFVKSFSAPDDHTVVVTAKSSKSDTRYYFGLLYQMTFPIVPASKVTEDNPPGSGPYMVTVFEPGSSLILDANPNWWKLQPYVKKIIFSLYSAPKQVIESYETGKVSAIFSRSISCSQYNSGTHSVSVSSRTCQLDCLLTNNTSYELTPEVRKAIRYVIDRPKIISNVYSGMAVQTNFPFYPGTWMYNESLDSMFTVNIEEAKRLLDEAGWEDTNDNGIRDRENDEGKLQELSLSFYVYEEPDNDVRIETANMIAEQLREVGIDCRINTMTMANVKEKLSAGKFDLALVSYALDVCPDPGFVLIKGNSGNYVRYKSDRMTNLCNELRKEINQESYRQKLMEIQSLFAEDCPFICLFFRTGFVISKSMYTTCRDVREYELLRGIAEFTP